MKTITKYQANDGSEWNSKAEAIERESLIARVAAVMAPLGEVPEAVKQGSGWVQHDIETVLTARDGIMDLCRSMGMFEGCKWRHDLGRDCHPLGIVGRILSEDNGPIGDAWGRFGTIDEQGREHQQPYYAINGPLPEHICIKDRRNT